MVARVAITQSVPTFAPVNTTTRADLSPLTTAPTAAPAAVTSVANTTSPIPPTPPVHVGGTAHGVVVQPVAGHGVNGRVTTPGQRDFDPFLRGGGMQLGVGQPARGATLGADQVPGQATLLPITQAAGAPVGERKSTRTGRGANKNAANVYYAPTEDVET